MKMSRTPEASNPKWRGFIPDYVEAETKMITFAPVVTRKLDVVGDGVRDLGVTSGALAVLSR